MQATLSKLLPFGVELNAVESLRHLQVAELIELVAVHRVAVLRNVATPTDEEILAFCGQLGEVMEWAFGSFNELKVDPQAKNYLYTKRAVPFHWDGAFAGRVPHYIFFQCVESGAIGERRGETIFCDAVQLVKSLRGEERQRCEEIEITYSTEKVVHYGGSFTAPVIDTHPVSGEPTCRYAEPVSDLNPVKLQIHGLPEDEQGPFIRRMASLLYSPANCYEHQWQTGDLVIADNHALLHGRRAFGEFQNRHLRRVNVL